MNPQEDRRYTQTEDYFILKDLFQMEKAPNYNSWQYSLVEPYIGKRVLEIGSGIGNISRHLINHTDILVGIEPNPYCVKMLTTLFTNVPQFILINKRIQDCGLEELKNYHFDTILCMNVLEHIEDDGNLLLFFEDILAPNGKVVLLVPAIPQAYGAIDKAVGHFRRYTKSTMKDILNKTSLRTEKMFYFNFLGLLGWMYNAHIRKITFQKDSQIAFFNKILPIIAFIEGKIGCPIGQSLICVSKVER